MEEVFQMQMTGLRINFKLVLAKMKSLLAKI